MQPKRPAGLGHRASGIRRSLTPMVSAGAIALLSVLFSCEPQADTADSSHPPAASGAVADPMFAHPYIDVDEWRNKPVRHRYVHGGFKGTNTRFSFYFPPKDKYQGRFYQYITPVPDSEHLSQGKKGEEDKIGFSISSGAYFIETNGGGSAETGGPGFNVDPTIAAYRANAAAARYSRVLAEKMYGGKRPYGYTFGGSGGAYRTVGGMENTQGVWDGAVPYVMGSPVAAPNVFTVRMYAMRVLWNKFPDIVDALDVGGSGNPYAGLTVEQRQALAEATRMGFPPRSWFGYKTMGVHAFTALYKGMLMADPGYFREFWTRPGYLGANPPPSLLKARLQFPSTIKASIDTDQANLMGLDIGRMPGQGRGTADEAWQALRGTGTERPVAFELTDTPPDVHFLGGDLIIKSGAAAGKSVELRAISGNKVILGITDLETLALIRPGDQVEIDNSNFLAAQTYHRHQLPGPEYPEWNQFLDPFGRPIYPQRKIQLGPLFTKGAAGTIPTGAFHGKMILLDSLWDREAFPWQADWYRQRVKEHFGAKTDQHFRLWYMDHALHGDFTKQEYPTYTVSYLGALQQALRDLSAWVEKGIPPPADTNYKVVDGQVIVPPTAKQRNGIQPVVTLTADGGLRADVAVGQPVTLKAVIDVPPGTGRVIETEWDFNGAGTFPVAHQYHGKEVKPSLVVTTTHTFTRPGTYFPVLRATSQRDGLADAVFTRIQNLARVRIVVK